MSKSYKGDDVEKLACHIKNKTESVHYITCKKMLDSSKA